MNILHLLIGLFFPRRGAPLTLLLLLIITVAGSPLSAFASNQESSATQNTPVITDTKNVLVLFSYHRAVWSDNVQKGIESVFRPYQNVNFFYEYMDTKRLRTREYLGTLRSIYIEKYAEVHIDAVISVDNNALNLLAENARTLFPDTPVVFCGINDYKPTLHAARPNVTGVVEYGDFSDTLKIAIRARPNATKLYVISDHTETGEINTRDLLAALSSVAPSIQAVLTDRMSYEELSTTLQTAASHQVAFFVSFWKDGTGHNIEPMQLDTVFRKSAIPVFGRSEWMINHGMVGGKCVTGFAQGEAAARLALKILGGTPISALPVNTNSPNQYLFDYQMMQHHQIDENIFPDESIGFNTPEPFFRVSKPVGVTVLVFSALLLATLFFLAVSIHQRRKTLFTLRKTAASLEQSESRYRGMIENIQDIFYRTDGQGHLTFISPSGALVLGYDSPQEMIGIPIESLWNVSDERQNMLKIMEQDGVVRDYEIVLVRKDGLPVPVSTTSSYYHDNEGEKLGEEGIFRDITERKQAEYEKEKLEIQNRQLQKSESLGRMAGAIAHHFNNKLFTVMGYLDLVIDGLTSGETTKKHLINARREADKAAEVSKLMLTYLGQVTGKPQVLNLSEVCQNMLPLLERTVPENVAMKTSLQSPGPVIKANVDHIRQVLTNLVTNAGEAAGNPQGSIHLAVKTVFARDIPTSHRFPVDWQPGDTPYALLEIRDNGCGIAEKDIEEIFSPFFSTKFTGRGLGLPVVLGLVKAYKGVLTVESSPGMGSVLRAYFPITAEEIAQQPDPLTGAPEHHETGTVLLVDDDPIVLELSSVMLSTLGFTVLTAMDGIEAVDIFRQHNDEIRLVLSDVSMPRMNGWETLLVLRQISPDIPVILASGYSENLIMQGIHDEHPQAFLEKPYGLAALRDTIRRTLL